VFSIKNQLYTMKTSSSVSSHSPSYGGLTVNRIATMKHIEKDAHKEHSVHTMSEMRYIYC
jgi:hypothetical protein